MKFLIIFDSIYLVSVGSISQPPFLNISNICSAQFTNCSIDNPRHRGLVSSWINSMIERERDWIIKLVVCVVWPCFQVQSHNPVVWKLLSSYIWAGYSHFSFPFNVSTIEMEREKKITIEM